MPDDLDDLRSVEDAIRTALRRAGGIPRLAKSREGRDAIVKAAASESRAVLLDRLKGANASAGQYAEQIAVLTGRVAKLGGELKEALAKLGQVADIAFGLNNALAHRDRDYLDLEAENARLTARLAKMREALEKEVVHTKWVWVGEHQEPAAEVCRLCGESVCANPHAPSCLLHPDAAPAPVGEGVAYLWQELLEKGDRTSPEEYPDMALITRGELADFIERAAPAPQDDRVDGELRIIFDGPPGPDAGRFVECETADGRSINAGDWRERPDGLWELQVTSLSSQDSADGWRPTHRHKKRGTTYRAVSDADVQASEPIREGDPVVVYQGEDGRYWVRPRAEFHDGRFELLDYPTPAHADQKESDDAED